MLPIIRQIGLTDIVKSVKEAYISLISKILREICIIFALSIHTDVKFEIVEIEELSGEQGKIYSVYVEDRELTLFDEFVEKNDEQYRQEVDGIFSRLQAMGNDIGFRHDFFKHNEGRPGDGVCALYDIPDRQLRLYCIKYGGVAIILGSGGEKKVQTWQDDDKLKANAQLMIRISNLITLRIAQKELRLTPGGLVGNLIWEDEEYE